jgi:hypothetical protein
MIDMKLLGGMCDMYYDYRVGLNFLKELDYDRYEYPNEVTNIHIYTEVKNSKELECIKSCLATQNLDNVRPIIWSDYNIEDNDFIQPYKEYLDLRVYDPVEEARGTILENNRVWITSDISDRNHYMKSGILRFLVTHKYGGIWADMDMVFLRDLKPILDQEWAYMWGSETDFKGFGPCAAMMNIHKDSHHSRICMEEILNTHVVPDSTVLDHMLLARVYSRRPFDVFPSTFFNTEWLISKVDEPLSRETEENWFYNRTNIAKDNLFLNAFSWHWHNSSKKDYPIQIGSKFSLLRKRTNQLLKEKGII